MITQRIFQLKKNIFCSLQRHSETISVNNGNLNREKYGLRVEGIIDLIDGGNSFDNDVRTFSTLESRVNNKKKK